MFNSQNHLICLKAYCFTNSNKINTHFIYGGPKWIKNVLLKTDIKDT